MLYPGKFRIDLKPGNTSIFRQNYKRITEEFENERSNK